jgi:hypothetical protein
VPNSRHIVTLSLSACKHTSIIVSCNVVQDIQANASIWARSHSVHMPGGFGLAPQLTFDRPSILRLSKLDVDTIQRISHHIYSSCASCEAALIAQQA